MSRPYDAPLDPNLDIILRNGSVMFQTKYETVKSFTPYVLELGFEDTKASPGGYFTGFPISPLEYRKRHPTKASVQIERALFHTRFLIRDDYGILYVLSLPNKFKEKIEEAIENCRQQELLIPEVVPHAG